MKFQFTDLLSSKRKASGASSSSAYELVNCIPLPDHILLALPPGTARSVFPRLKLLRTGKELKQMNFCSVVVKNMSLALWANCISLFSCPMTPSIELHRQHHSAQFIKPLNPHKANSLWKRMIIFLLTAKIPNARRNLSAEEKKLYPYFYILQIILVYIQHTDFPQINHFKQFC